LRRSTSFHDASEEVILLRVKRRTKVPLVLVVDDYEDTRTIYTEYLRFAGFRVAYASDGADAVTKAKALVPDVVVMDLAMPGVDGWTATKQLKTDPRTKDIFVLAVTGCSEDAARVEAWRSGCDAFLEKPVLPAELVRRIVGRLTEPLR
jgi:two-component system cell cycle response regulator DivK